MTLGTEADDCTHMSKFLKECHPTKFVYAKHVKNWQFFPERYAIKTRIGLPSSISPKTILWIIGLMLRSFVPKILASRFYHPLRSRYQVIPI